MTLIAPHPRRRPVTAAATARRGPGVLRRPAALLAGSGLVLLPWMVVLAKTLPATTQVSHWNTAWVGLDAMMAAGLLGTGLLLRRADPRAAPLAAATAALLVTDAWFDVTTSDPGAELATALTMAFCAELPLAVVCGVLALRRPDGARER
ncbi:hypothetical protein [Streptomyces sp. NPDC089919]|uniref:hypothetical protein n=1 Tax=Streptomyces sp. NPDC089919 TaxID=3155188 RepID=UPI003437A5F5